VFHNGRAAEWKVQPVRWVGVLGGGVHPSFELTRVHLLSPTSEKKLNEKFSTGRDESGVCVCVFILPSLLLNQCSVPPPRPPPYVDVFNRLEKPESQMESLGDSAVMAMEAV